jgi:hypothetical protein
MRNSPILASSAALYDVKRHQVTGASTVSVAPAIASGLKLSGEMAIAFLLQGLSGIACLEKKSKVRSLCLAGDRHQRISPLAKYYLMHCKRRNSWAADHGNLTAEAHESGSERDGTVSLWFAAT